MKQPAAPCLATSLCVCGRGGAGSSLLCAQAVACCLPPDDAIITAIPLARRCVLLGGACFGANRRPRTTSCTGRPWCSRPWTLWCSRWQGARACCRWRGRCGGQAGRQAQGARVLGRAHTCSASPCLRRHPKRARVHACVHAFAGERGERGSASCSFLVAARRDAVQRRLHGRMGRPPASWVVLQARDDSARAAGG